MNKIKNNNKWMAFRKMKKYNLIPMNNITNIKRVLTNKSSNN